MLFLRSTDYDDHTRVLKVRYATPSGSSWASFEYRDVPDDVVDRLRAARPHGRRVLEQQVIPFHDVRRAGQTTWQAPANRSAPVTVGA
ncbi:KTSC domain-containing protein [Actinotalea sp. K2]|uniref:KTSC domain-containing protein n=1 Tax=Actinotalea sp. K2 TaxID=2939438 RepID=UPI002016E24D|nr:KTSC domain-containing protein [Actinotalea sp. K2]MCL3862245.1 KTSC domain-containing protein [Actinotalea sp. K2]